MPELSFKSDILSDHDTSDNRKVKGLDWQQIALALNASSFVLQITRDYQTLPKAQRTRGLSSAY